MLHSTHVTTWPPAVLARREVRSLMATTTLQLNSCDFTPSLACNSVTKVGRLPTSCLPWPLALAAGADVYIAAHGSQLTNTIFMPDGALLVEILPWSLPGLRIYRNINNAVWRRWRQVGGVGHTTGRGSAVWVHRLQQ